MIDVVMSDGNSKVQKKTTDFFKCSEDQNLPLIEKYRPKTLKEMVSHEEILNTINLFVEKKNIPHFLFHGPPGTGKTSCILAIARMIHGENFKRMTLELNASDDRGINVVRDKIKEFCNTIMISSRGGIKLVILDEADMMTSAAQFSLRRVIEKYTKNARFCLICNQVSKIIPAIQSRCMKFRFSPLKKEQCIERIKFICQTENIPIDEKTIDQIVGVGKGDMRKILNVLESTYMSYGTVNKENVYACTGLPNPSQIDYILTTVFEKDFGTAFKELYEFKISNGFALEDIVLEILKIVKKNDKVNQVGKIALYKQIRQMDYLNTIGGSEKLVLSNLISTILKLKN